MNEHDALERELAALQPQLPSASLKARIAERLHERLQASRPDEKPMSSRRGWQLALALALVLAISAIVAMRRWQRPAPTPRDVAAAAADWKSTFGPSHPTLWRFHQALADPGALDELLNQDSQRGDIRLPKPIHAGAFSIFISTEPSATGEL